jgi:hypothetical protein
LTAGNSLAFTIDACDRKGKVDVFGFRTKRGQNGPEG